MPLPMESSSARVLAVVVEDRGDREVVPLGQLRVMRRDVQLQKQASIGRARLGR